jgi:hypothetical protein
MIDAARVLRRLGWFSWGKDAWIHQDDEGTVLSTNDALRQEGLLDA